MMKKMFLIVMIFLLFGCGALVLYAKTRIRHLSYVDFSGISKYEILERDLYENMFDLENFFADDNIRNPEDLYNLSEYVLIVEVQDKYLAGHGILNNCVVKKVLKGSDININDNIQIYDLVGIWSEFASMYLDGNTPLKISSQYIVFLKKTERANLQDSYVFISSLYGHVFANEKLEVMNNYEEDDLTIKEASNYQHLFSYLPEEKWMEYQNFVYQIQEMYGE